MSKTLNKAVDVLEALAQARSEVSLSTLSQTLDMHPSTVHRLLRTLVRRGFVRQDPATRKYALGYKLSQLANAVPYHTHLIETARPTLVKLSSEVGETVNLVVRYQYEALNVHQVQSEPVTRAFAGAGSRAPLHCSGVGKVLLAYSSAEDIESYIEKTGLPAYTINTIANPYVLREELAKVRDQGFAVGNEEWQLGVVAVAAPVRDSSGNVIAAISVSGTVKRLTDERWPTVAARLKDAAAVISSGMGYVHDAGE